MDEVDDPDPDRKWVHADGDLHVEPPLPVARVYFLELGDLLPVAGWFPPIEAPACGVMLAFPADLTTDGQPRWFMCDRREGHCDTRRGEPDEHRTVISDEHGLEYRWRAGHPLELDHRH